MRHLCRVLKPENVFDKCTFVHSGNTRSSVRASAVTDVGGGGGRFQVQKGADPQVQFVTCTHTAAFIVDRRAAGGPCRPHRN